MSEAPHAIAAVSDPASPCSLNRTMVTAIAPFQSAWAPKAMAYRLPSERRRAA